MKILSALVFSILIIASAAERFTARPRPLSMKELIIRIKFCQAKVNHYSIYTSMISILDLQQMRKSTQIWRNQSKTCTGKDLKVSSKYSAILNFFQTCRLLFELPKCCKHKSYKSNGLFWYISAYFSCKIVWNKMSGFYSNETVRRFGDVPRSEHSNMFTKASILRSLYSIISFKSSSSSTGSKRPSVSSKIFNKRCQACNTLHVTQAVM